MMEPFPARLDGRVAIVVKGWPRLSETFLAQEVLALEQRGLRQVLISLRHPTDRTEHALTRAVRAPVLYLPEYLHQEPLRVLTGLYRATRLPGWRAARAAWWADLRLDPTRNRTRRFGQACVLANELPPDVRWLHSHFLHTPASVTRYAALLTGRPWSVSAHAKDIWTTPAWEKRRKLAEAAWAVTCTRQGWVHLRDLAPCPDRVGLVYHGLDMDRFPPPPPRPPRDGRNPAEPVRLLSVGRLVEKKGFDLLLAALARLDPDLHWRWRHVGTGPERRRLHREADRLGLTDRITWLGSQAHDTVIAEYAAADLFILPCRRARDGDQDGLPNVLMEALVMGVAVLSAETAAVPELIDSGCHGILVPPNDITTLTTALTKLCRDPAERRRLAMAGRQRVVTDFTATPGIDALMARFMAELAIEPTVDGR